jgi:hypothetical protein
MIYLKYFYKIVFLICLSGICLIGCDSKTIPGNLINVSQGEANNHAPMTSNVSKTIAKNSLLTLSLIALSSDQDGDELTYFTLGDLPKHGTLLLVHTEKPSLIYQAFTSERLQKKFDGHHLSIQYRPNKDFIGQDKFSYQLTDARGLQSKPSQVNVFVTEKGIQETNHPPIANNLKVTTHVKESVYIDLHSLAVDEDGDRITFSFIKKWGQTYTDAKHGKMILGSYIDYLPETAGVESISFYVCSKGYCDKSVKGVVTIQTLMPSGGILGKLKVLPKSRFIMMSIMAAISIMMFVFALWFVSQYKPKQLKWVGTVMLLLGLTVLFSFLSLVSFSSFASLSASLLAKHQLSLKLCFLGILLVGGGYSCLFPTGTLAFWTGIARLMKKKILLVLIMMTNALILFYHFTGITLPAIALDIYLPIYNSFKYDIIGHDIGPAHSQRILLPFLASLLPLGTVLSFKVVNSIFINLAVIVLYRIWKDLNIKLYLIVIAFLWLFLHVYGVIRLYNFYPTTVYAPSYFFNAALIYVILKKQYKWFLLLLPIGALQYSGFMIINLAFFGYKFLVYFFGVSPTKEGNNALFTIGVSNILMLVALELPEILINPQVPHNSGIIEGFEYHFIWASLGFQNFNIVILMITYFVCYGGLLLLGIQKFNHSYQNTELYHGLIIFFAVHLVIAMNGSITSYSMLWPYPFLMTLILLSINQVNPLKVMILVIASIPLLRVSIDFPFVLDPGLYQSSRGPYLSLWGTYMIVLYIFSNYLMKSSISLEALIRFFKENTNLIKR